MDLRGYAQLVRRFWILICASVLAGALGGTAYAVLQPPQYTATAKAYVATGGSSTSVQDRAQENAFTQQMLETYAQVAVTPYVLDHVISSLGLQESVQQLLPRVAIAVPTNTVLLEVSVSDGSPTRAAAIANAITSDLASAATTLTGDTSARGVQLTQLQDASTNTQRTGLKLPVGIAIGAALGLAVALVVAFLRELFDTRLRRPADLPSVTEAPLLGEIVFDKRFTADPLIIGGDSQEHRVEAFRALRANLQYVQPVGALRSMVVTSALASEGKTTTAANIAIAMSAAGRKVLVVDADLRRPKIAELFSLDGSLGLSDVLIGKTPLEEAVQRWGDEGLVVLPAGGIPPNPGELLQSAAMTELIARLEGEYDLVIYDSAPLLPVADTTALAHQVSGSLVVASARRVRKPELRSAIGTLGRVDARVLGVVITMLPMRGPNAQRYRRYGYA